jgi:hypothetical protein
MGNPVITVSVVFFFLSFIQRIIKILVLQETGYTTPYYSTVDAGDPSPLGSQVYTK